MTIFEMLEKLETEIVSLQARYQDLAKSLQHSQANGNGIVAPDRRKRASTRTKKKAAKHAKKSPKSKQRASSKKVSDFEQLELAVEAPAAAGEEQQQGRTLGKRQALGKSLVQLRKMSAWRTGRSSDE